MKHKGVAQRQPQVLLELIAFQLTLPYVATTKLGTKMICYQLRGDVKMILSASILILHRGHVRCY